MGDIASECCSLWIIAVPGKRFLFTLEIYPMAGSQSFCVITKKRGENQMQKTPMAGKKDAAAPANTEAAAQASQKNAPSKKGNRK